MILVHDLSFIKMHECLYTSGVWFDSQCLSLFEKGRSIDRPIQMVSNMYACTVDLKHSQVKVNYEETRTGVLIRPYVYIYIYIYILSSWYQTEERKT